jgi:ornithine lipid hydroxylase
MTPAVVCRKQQEDQSRVGLRAEPFLRGALRRLVWPLCLGVNATSILVVARWFPQIVSPVSAITTLILLALLVVLENRIPYRSDWTMRHDPDMWRDLGHSLAYAGLGVNASRVLFLGVLAQAMSRVGLVDVLRIWPTRSPQWFQAAIVIVVGDFLEYAYHRISHAHHWLWRIHAIHHMPVRLSAVKGARHHVLYALGRAIVVWLPLLILGAPGHLVYWQFIAETMVGLPAHANIQFHLPRWAHWVAVTPDFHRLHHSTDRRLGNSNFGVVFPFWDVTFGTHSDPLRLTAGEAGIEDDVIPRRLEAEFGWPFVRGTIREREGV